MKVPNDPATLLIGSSDFLLSAVIAQVGAIGADLLEHLGLVDA